MESKMQMYRVKKITKSEIIMEIEAMVMNEGHKDYSYWKIGNTDRPTPRKKQFAKQGENTKFWKQWFTVNKEDSLDICRYFIEKGMKSGLTKETGANYVYVF